MKKRMTKILSLLVAGAMTVATFVGCGSTGKGNNKGSSGRAKIGVLVADVSGEEAQGFRNYYEKYIASNYDVEFTYTDALESAEDEKAAIEKFASQGCDAIISLK